MNVSPTVAPSKFAGAVVGQRDKPRRHTSALSCPTFAALWPEADSPVRSRAGRRAAKRLAIPQSNGANPKQAETAIPAGLGGALMPIGFAVVRDHAGRYRREELIGHSLVAKIALIGWQSRPLSVGPGCSYRPLQ